MDVRVRVLGGFELEGIEPHRLGSRKARTLLKVLALARGAPVSVDQLLEAVWPQGLPSRPEEQLAVLVSRLRAVLGAERLPRSDAGYALVAEWLDLDALAELAVEASRRLAAGSAALARGAAESALKLARGPLLPDELDAEWLSAERSAAERLVAMVRHTASEAALAARDHDGAVAHAGAALDRDPYDEAALRLLLRAHAGAGRPAAALDAYGRARERLSDDLGVDPAGETEELYLAILRQEPLPGAVPAEPAAAGAATSLPGRDRELVALDAALDQAAGGAAQLMVVEGEAGIGKTRLLETWAGRAAAAGVLVLRARCDELERSLPLQPIIDALDAYLLTLPGPETVRPVLGPQQRLLGPLLRASPADPHPPTGDPTGGQAALFAAFLAVFDRLAARATVALLLDDLHLADRASVEWLHFVASHGATARLLVVAALRSEEAVPLPAARRLPLGPLDLAAARLLVGEGRAAELHARSGGHPLFLVELASAAEDVLPTSLREAVAARCERAGPAVAATLRTAALLGLRIDVDLLAAVLKLPPLTLLDHLEDGARRRLLLEDGEGFAFRHELLREALGAGVSVMRRALIHREAARALAARPHTEPLDVAYHARLGGDVEMAAAAFAEAAHQAAGRYDYAESERLLDRAVALHDSGPVRVQRARIRMVRGDYEGAGLDAAAALDLGAGAAALEVAGWAAYYRRDFATARRFADDGSGLASGTIRSSCLALAGRIRHADGDLAGAAVRLEEALALADDPLGRVAPAVWLGALRCHQGNAAEALALAGPVARRLRGVGMPMVTVYAQMTTAYALATLGRAAAALEALDAWDAEIDRQHADRFKGRPNNFRAWVLRGLGDPVTADELNHRALEEARRIGIAEQEAHALLDLATGRLQAGDLDAAASHLAAAEPLHGARHVFCWRHALRDHLLRARLALASGEVERARSLTRELRREADALGAARYVDFAALLEVRVAAALGERIDPGPVGALLHGLSRRAGLEAWWWAAEVAAATRIDGFWDLAEAAAAALAEQAGGRAERFRRHAGAHLERLRAVGARA